MRIAKTKNAISGSLWGIAYRIVCTVFPFIIRTIIIKEFGEKYLGLNSLFTSILHVLNLSELGITNSIVYSMYKPIAEDDYEKLSALIAFYRKLYFAIGTFILAAGLCCIPFIPRLISGDYPSGVNIYILYLVFLLNTVVSYFFFGYKEAILTAYQRIDIINLIRLVTFLAQFIFQIGILLIVKNYYLYSSIMIVFTVMRGYLNSILVRKRYPQIVCKGKIDKNELKVIKVNMAGVTLGKLCTVSRGTFDEIIMSSFLGLSALAIFDNYYYIISAIVAIMNVVENSLISGVGNSIVIDTVEKNYNDFKKINFIYMWLVGICSCCLFCLYQPFMKIWVGEELMIDNTTMILFVLYFYSGCLCSISNVYSTAKGLWWNLRVKSVFEIIVNLGLNILLVVLYGMQGIIIATVISYVFVSFCWGSYVLFKEYFGIKLFWPLLYSMVFRFLLTFSACTICCLLLRFLPVTNMFLSLAARLFLALAISNIVFVIVFRKTEYFQYMKSLLAMLMKPFYKA